MNALKANYEKIIFLIALLVLGWSAYSVFASISSYDDVTAPAIKPKNAAAVTNEVYEAYWKDLETRFQATDVHQHVGFIGERRFVCLNPDCQRFVEFDDTVESIKCKHCGMETKPDQPDRDYDGMSNEYEVVHGLDPYNDDAELDLDGDGFWNIVEHDAGTLPNDETDHPPFTPFLYATNMVNDPVPLVLWSGNSMGGGKYMIQLRDLRNRKSPSIPLGNDYGPYTLLEFEKKIIKAHNAKDASGKTVFVPQQDQSVLTILHKEKNRKFTLPYRKRGGDDWTAEIRSTIDSNFVAQVDEDTGNSFSFRDETYDILDITEQQIWVKERSEGSTERALGRQPELLDPNTREAPTGFPAGFGPDGGLFEGDFGDPSGLDDQLMLEYYKRFNETSDPRAPRRTPRR